MGLSKDQPQIVLKESRIAVIGNGESTFWHMGNFRKDPPAPLPFSIKKNQKGTSAEGRNTRLTQEWLIKPSYIVWVALPEPFHGQFEDRLKTRKWHFSPCLGLTEHFAHLSEPLAVGDLQPLAEGDYKVFGTIRRQEATIDLDQVYSEGFVIHPIMMPRDVTETRSFSHDTYYWEPNAKPISVKTSHAWKAGSDILMFL